MQTKLTLRMDRELIQLAKDHARKNGKSMSKFVADYFSLVGKELDQDNHDIPAITASLHGVLEGRNVDREQYREHLEEKYL